MTYWVTANNLGKPKRTKYDIREKNHNYSILQFHRNLTVFMCKLGRISTGTEITDPLRKKTPAKSKNLFTQILKNNIALLI